jgi:hypothetical protein
MSFAGLGHANELMSALFAALAVAGGVTISNCYRRYRHQEFQRFLNDMDANLPSDFDVHLVMDNTRWARCRPG